MLEIQKFVDDVLKYEKKYKRNSIEILHGSFAPEIENWKNTVRKIIFYGESIFTINKQQKMEVYYYTNKKLIKDKRSIKEKIDDISSKPDNRILLINNNLKDYESIIKYCNLKSLNVVLLTDNREDFSLMQKYRYLIVELNVDNKKEQIWKENTIYNI